MPWYPISNCLGGVLDKMKWGTFTPTYTASGSFCSLRMNKLGEQTGIALGEALKTNTSLKNLK